VAVFGPATNVSMKREQKTKMTFVRPQQQSPERVATILRMYARCSIAQVLHTTHARTSTRMHITSVSTTTHVHEQHFRSPSVLSWTHLPVPVPLASLRMDVGAISLGMITIPRCCDTPVNMPHHHAHHRILPTTYCVPKHALHHSAMDGPAHCRVPAHYVAGGQPRTRLAHEPDGRGTCTCVFVFCVQTCVHVCGCVTHNTP
jgi:hypothetical protein